MNSPRRNCGMTFRSSHFMVWLLIFTFFLPAPLAGVGAGVGAGVRTSQAASRADNGRADDGAQGWNRHIHERLNSAERRAAIEEAAKREAEMAKAETAPASAQAPAFSQPAAKKTQQAVAARKAQRPEASKNTLAANEQRPDSRLGGGDTERPQSIGAALFNYGAGFLGVPGLTPQRKHDGRQDGGQPRRGAGAFSGEPGFTPGVARPATAHPAQDVRVGGIQMDEGLGFHQDGTVRKAGGTASASGPSDRGQRAQAYMRSGLQGGAAHYGGSGYGGYASTIWEPGYDPVTGIHWRGDPTSGGRISVWSGHSRNLDGFDPFGMALDKGLSYGAGLLNSAGEAAISSLVDGGRARLNFMMDKDGYFSGEGDALLPFYDSVHTTIYTQLGARSMHDPSDTRWIGNFGIGQRWFPFATGEDIKSADYDAGSWMFGYNAFFDYDLTRDHQRGGLGLETQYDWLRLAANYYFPISDWKGSEDFDNRFVKERPAEGWDLRAKGYLPFYRNIAITGAYTQWYGDHVGMFGYKELEKDPRVWSYGIEYTPIPLVSGFITQKSTERGRTDTEFGLNFTYHFNMPWEEQISHSKVAELRTVGGARHEFVDRENRIILEYKAKSNFHIEYIGRSGDTFRFRVINAFGEFLAGKTVLVSAGGGVTLAAAPASGPASGEDASLFAQALNFLDELISVSAAHAASSVTKITDSRGEFDVTITSPITGQITLTASIEGQEASVTVSVTSSSPPGLAFNQASYTIPGITPSDSTTLQLTAFDTNGVPLSGDITWTITSPGGNNGATLSSGTSTIDAEGKATVTISGNNVQREVTVQASLPGQPSVTATVRFGAQLPSGLITGDVNLSSTLNYAAAETACINQDGRLPTTAELQNMTGSWTSSGLSGGYYRTGDWDDFGSAHWLVNMPSGVALVGTGLDDDITLCRVVCHAP